MGESSRSASDYFQSLDLLIREYWEQKFADFPFSIFQKFQLRKVFNNLYDIFKQKIYKVIQ
ncbi:MAG: hypothetical protein AMS27_18345 [Bacteroides sp. SM23_62_1]|nr:MAG: hypothetical protein AMS27_18345 [Bacteroides sp. SM23_62_1]